MKDTNDFINKPDACSGKNDDQRILVAMDVRSLYTNISSNEGIRAVQQFLIRTGKSTLIQVITKFLWLILILNAFIFNGKRYLQTDGASMGTKCAPD